MYTAASSIYFGAKAFHNQDGDRQNDIYNQVKYNFVSFSNEFQKLQGTAGGDNANAGENH